MPLTIIKGDPFSINITLHDNDSNTNIDLSTGWNITVALKTSSPTGDGNTLPGTTHSFSNGTVNVFIDDTDTINYPEGSGVMLYKFQTVDKKITLRQKESVKIIQAEI